MRTDVSLAERLAVQDVMTRYAAGVDDRDMVMYRDCFADDAEIVGFSGGTIVGADTWVEEVEKKLSAFEATQHMLGPQIVTVDGDRASTRTDVQALHCLKSEPGSMMILWAVYLTEYKRIFGQWKISRHELVRRGTRTVKAE